MNVFATLLNHRLEKDLNINLLKDPISGWYLAHLDNIEILYIPPVNNNKHDRHVIVSALTEAIHPIYEVILPNDTPDVLKDLTSDIANIENNFTKIMEDLLYDTGFYDTVKLELKSYMI